MKLMLKPISVVFADDHPLVRDGLRAVLDEAEGLKVAAVAVDGQDLIDKVAEYLPDVILVDIQMPGMDGLEAVRRIRQTHPGVKAIILSGHDAEHFIRDSLRAGASGYLLKTIPSEQLIEGIKRVASGEALLGPSIARTMMDKFARLPGDRPDRNEALSPREREVIELMAEGKSNKEIAKELGVGAQTAKTHVSNILKKLGVPDRAGAVAEAFRSGLVS